MDLLTFELSYSYIALIRTMANKNFEFKNFTVNQDRCGMKVCTDSCLFGAWMADRFSFRNPGKILDIGTGTGLLSLMVAQKTNAVIDAFEIDEQACTQANENFESSPWSSKLHAYPGNIKLQPTLSKYDGIICNPPFYDSHLLPANEGKKASKHGTLLSLEELALIVSKLLASDGVFGVLLPSFSAAYFEKEAEKHSLFITEKCEVRQTFNHNFFRSMLILEKEKRQAKYSEMSIKDNLGNYTPEFTELLKEYYLYL